MTKRKMILALVTVCLIVVIGGYLISQNFTLFGNGNSAEIPRYTLVEATEDGLVSCEFHGRGYCSGDSIEFEVESEVEFEIEIEIGWVLINSGLGQNMIIAEELTINLKPEVEIERTIESYCLDYERPNPSSQESFELQIEPGAYGLDAVKLIEFINTAPENRTSIEAVQIALWVLLDDVVDIPISHSESDILDAKWLLENTGVEVSEKRLFQIVGKTEEEIRQKFEAEYEASAQIVDMVLTTEDFEITLSKMGMFSGYIGEGDFAEGFRVDLKVKNVGDESAYFSVWDVLLNTTEGVFDERSYYETITSGDIAEGKSKEGYLLFSKVPEEVTVEEMVIYEVSGDAPFYFFDFEHDEAYTILDVYEELYLKSAIVVEETISQGDFSITLLRVGSSPYLDYDMENLVIYEATGFRVDLRIKSISGEIRYLPRSDIFIVDNLGNVYSSDIYTYGIVELGQFNPDAIKEGFVLFPSLNENASQIEIVIDHYSGQIRFMVNL